MRRPFLACALLASAPDAAFAARPMITDDARIVDAKSCQVESWVKRNAASTEAWALPACNPFGNAELTFGGARTREDGVARFTDEQVQVKTLFRAYEPDSGWGIGLAVGTLRHPARERAAGWPGDAYAYVPVSFAARGDDLVIHVNAGATRHRDEGRTIGTWGVGAEWRLSESWFAIPEVFSTDRGRPFFQAGVRHWVVPNRVQVDATFGNRLVSDRADRWFSIGLRLLSPAFLP